MHRIKRAAKERRRKLVIQKLMGLGILALCVILLLWAMEGQTPEEQDCTALVLLVPMALCLIFSRSVLIY